MSGARFWTVGLLVLVACAAVAETLPAAVDGVITLDVPAGTTNVYSGALASATKLVKTGRGWAELGTATTAFTGATEVHEGVVGVWKAYRVGTTIKFGMIHATTVVLR